MRCCVSCGQAPMRSRCALQAAAVAGTVPTGSQSGPVGRKPHARPRPLSRTSHDVRRGPCRDRAQHLEPGERRALHHRHRHRQLDLASPVRQGAAAASVAGPVEPLRRRPPAGDVAFADHAHAVPARRHHRRGGARRLHRAVLSRRRLRARGRRQRRGDPHRRGDQAAEREGDRRTVRRRGRQVRLRHRRPQARMRARRARRRRGEAVQGAREMRAPCRHRRRHHQARADRQRRALGVAAFAVGGRLIACDERGAWTRVDDAAQRVAAELGIATDPATLAVGGAARGDRAPARRRRRRLTFSVRRRTRSAARSSSPSRFIAPKPPDAITFSGGVSEYVFGYEDRDYGDIARPLAAALRRELARRTTLPRDRSRPAHPRDRDRRLAVHRAGERQDHPSAGTGRAAGAQCSRRPCRARSRRRDRRRGARRGDRGRARPARPRTGRAARHRVRLARRSRISPARRRRPRHHGRGRAARVARARRCS